MDITSFILGYKKGKAAGGGGGSLEKGTYLLQFPERQSYLYDHRYFKYGGEYWRICKRGASSSSYTKHRVMYKVGDNSTTYIGVFDTLTDDLTLNKASLVEYNGLMYIFGNSTTFVTWDGSSLAENKSGIGVKVNNIRSAVVYGDYIYIINTGVYSGWYLYKFDGTTMTQVCSADISNSAGALFVWHDKLHLIGKNNDLYCFDDANNAFNLVETDLSLENKSLFNAEFVGNEWWYRYGKNFHVFNMDTGEDTDVAVLPYDTSLDTVRFYEYNGMKRCYECLYVQNTHLTILEVE